jgi:hypothetical protein
VAVGFLVALIEWATPSRQGEVKKGEQTAVRDGYCIAHYFECLVVFGIMAVSAHRLCALLLAVVLVREPQRLTSCTVLLLLLLPLCRLAGMVLVQFVMPGTCAEPHGRLTSNSLLCSSAAAAAAV